MSSIRLNGFLACLLIMSLAACGDSDSDTNVPDGPGFGDVSTVADAGSGAVDTTSPTPEDTTTTPEEDTVTTPEEDTSGPAEDVAPAPTCGDGTCDTDETCSSCEADCGACEEEPECGDGTCDEGETAESCPADCETTPEPTCGDGNCDTDETCSSCEEDCGACPTSAECGNDVCEEGETEQNCPGDCIETSCGDGTCNGDETCLTCVEDCDVCPASTLVITEIMKDTDGVSDEVGEWFEVTNVTDSDIDMQGMVIKDAGDDMHTIAESLVVAPGAYVVLAVSEDLGGAGFADYVWTTGEFLLSNGDDEIIIEDNATLVDAVYYDKDVNFVDPKGASLSLDPSATTADDNDNGANWCEGVDLMATADFGSPGAENPSCSTPAEPVCGDGACESGETIDSCPSDCGGSTGAVCGDGVCAETESEEACPEDCTTTEPSCGDGACDEGETAESCPEDCDATTEPTCGDGACNGEETAESCPDDCAAPSDPQACCEMASDATCGNAACIEAVGAIDDYCLDYWDESCAGCARGGYAFGGESCAGAVEACGCDNAVSCGDGVCNDDVGETPLNCTEDCPVDPAGCCDPESDAGCFDQACIDAVGAIDTFCTDLWDTYCATCASGGEAIDGTSCAGQTDVCNCPVTGPFCGDGTCDDGETCAICSEDCGTCAKPLPGDLIITEIMNNPSPAEDEVGEWFEVQNLSDVIIDLAGLTVKDDGSDSITIETSVNVLPGDYAVLGASADLGGVGLADYVYTHSLFTLANGADEIIIADGDTVLDAVSYDGGTTFPDPNGPSMNLTPATTDVAANDSGDAWCEATSPLGEGGFGTPGKPNDACSACADGNNIVDSYEPNDTPATAVSLPQVYDDQIFAGAFPAGTRSGTITNSEDVDWFTYFDQDQIFGAFRPRAELSAASSDPGSYELCIHMKCDDGAAAECAVGSASTAPDGSVACCDSGIAADETLAVELDGGCGGGFGSDDSGDVYVSITGDGACGSSYELAYGDD